jgi:hypothetical protein
MNKSGIAALAVALGLMAGTLSSCDRVTAADTAASAEQKALLDRLAIEDMMTRYYGNFGKTDAAEDFASFYTQDAEFDVNGIVSKGPEAIAAFYTDTGDDDEAPARQGTFHMIISNPIIDVDGDTATAQFFWTGVMNGTVEGRPELWEQGREYDQLVRVDGEWRVKKRVVIADSGLPERYKATYTPRADYDISAE